VAIRKGRVVFGRHRSCDCILADSTVSRQHFAIERVARKHLIVDLQSGNGTIVNGVRISWVELKNGDKIDAGPFGMIFDSDERNPETPSPDQGRPSFPDP
jgi:pSer/pThr/pTyr-binding forkhead associated (FHA) protein